MEVNLKSSTSAHNILEYVGDIAGVCTNKSGVNNEARAYRCLTDKHMSIFEHMVFTWEVEDVSRACTHQLVRHRIASYTQESQRYVKMNTFNDDWYIIPPSIDRNIAARFIFKACMSYLEKIYDKLIQEKIPAEDARYIIPNAAKTKIVITMNLREFISFYKLRTDPHAQWEIRELAECMYDEIRKGHPEVMDIFDRIL